MNKLLSDYTGYVLIGFISIFFGFLFIISLPITLPLYLIGVIVERIYEVFKK